MTVVLQELHDEIENDPQAIGYKTAGAWKGDDVIAALINDPANGAALTRRTVTPQELVAAIDLAEFEALAATRRDYLRVLLAAGDVIDANEAPVFAALVAIFPPGPTRTALLAKVNRQGSRAEILWGEGAVIAVNQVAAAANLGA